MAKKRLKRYLVTVEIKAKQWDYKIGDKTSALVDAVNEDKAIEKFEDENCGSEYPPYDVVSVELFSRFPFRSVIKNENISQD